MEEDNFIIVAEISLELSDSKCSETLSFTSRPSTAVEIKSRVEEVCSIPVCVQTISYQGTQVTDDCDIKSLYLRDGDTVQVSCLNKGNVADVKSAVKWLAQCVQILESLPHKKQEFKTILMNRRNSNLVRQSLFRWSDPSQLVNCYHFDYLGGVELLVKFHRLLVKNRQDKLHLSYENHNPYLEFVCCEGITKFSVNNEMSGRIAECGGLETCIGTFLMKPANDEGLLKHRAFHCVRVALEAIYNIVDAPNLQDRYLELIQDESVVEQVLAIAESPLYSSNNLLTSMSLLVCITRSPGSNKSIMKPDVIGKIISIFVNFKEKQQISGGDDSIAMTLGSYVGVILAQLVFNSNNVLATIPSTLMEKMTIVMKQASEVDPVKVQQYEESDGIVWGTFLHCVQCLYGPSNYDNSSQAVLINSLYEHASNALLHHLFISLGRKEHFHVVVEEELFDYVKILPWILPLDFQERALCICKELNKFQAIQPASLATLAKAHLAKSLCGLHKVMTAPSILCLLT